MAAVFEARAYWPSINYKQEHQNNFQKLNPTFIR